MAAPATDLPPPRIVSADQLEAIHEASLTILEEIGMDVLLPEARDIYAARGRRGRPAASGCAPIAAGRSTRWPTAPAGFTLHARNPAHNVDVGGNHDVLAGREPAQLLDLDGGRRPGNRADYQNFLRLGQTLNILHLTGGYPVEPIDIHADDPPPRRAARHLTR